MDKKYNQAAVTLGKAYNQAAEALRDAMTPEEKVTE